MFNNGTIKVKSNVNSKVNNNPNSSHGDAQVYLVGAGPGDPDLLTLRAYRLIQRADVIIYDRLVGKAILKFATQHCEMIYAGKRKNLHTMSQNEINQTLVDKSKQHPCVVRLKGGDSLIFGRISEEIDALNTAGVSWKIVPGITAASGAAASNGIPLTCRTDSHAVTYITAHNKQGVLDIDWEIATRPNHTVVFYMGLSLIDRIADTLLQRGVPSHTPFHIIANATRPNEFALHSTLGDIISDVEQYEIPSPALLILGPDRRVTETADDQTHVRLGLPQSY